MPVAGSGWRWHPHEPEGEGAMQLIPTSKVLKAGGPSVLRRFAWRAGARLLFEASLTAACRP